MLVAALKKFILLYVYVALTLSLGYFAANEGYSLGSIVLLLAFGLFSWSLIEYGLHRFIFHYDARSRFGRMLLYHAHLSHHENPEETKRHFASLILSVPIAAAYWVLAWAATGSWAAASYLFIGMAGGYFCYQWLHYQCHHGRSRLPLLRYLRRYHLLHHHKTPDLRFGVTSPLFDLVFGTFRPVVNRRLRVSRRAF
jgi:sterol desaturase/sphingolipid hydroxylase (fatty acid hydroxylase superfamily)